MALTASHIELEKLANPNDQWVILDKLGEGTYGEVFRMKCRDKDECLAAKIICLKTNECSSEYDNELNILRVVSKQHENLPDFVDIFGDKDQFGKPRIWFVMELCELGPITRLVKDIEEKIYINLEDKEFIVAYAVKCTLEALKYLHESGIMHRDVKGSHILVRNDYILKLIDYGVAATFTSERPRRNSCVGTSLWMAPEVIACAHQFDYTFDERCDIWSLGVTAIELADGEAPLSALNSVKVLYEVPRRPSPTLKESSKWSENFTKFISACLIKDYECRPHAKVLLENEGFVNFDACKISEYRDLLQGYHKKYLAIDILDKTIENVALTFENDNGMIIPWVENITKTADLIDRENNLADIDNLNSQLLIESLRRRFSKTLIYTFIGDFLLAINPKQYLPIDNINFQLKYSKYREDLLPHVFSIATKVYNQMMINRQAQCIILSGESGSGKTHAAQNLISELALLGFGEQNTLENRLVTMNILLEAFGNAKTELNNNSSRFGKLLDIFFSKCGTIVYAKLSEFLLEKTRVVLASGNTRNFHIFYSVHSHFSTNNLGPCKLNDTTAFELFQTTKSYAYLGSNSDQTLSLNYLFQILNELNINDDEQSSILAILTAIIHLGNISFQPEKEIDERGCSIDEQSIPHVESVYRLLKMDENRFIKSLCQSSLMMQGETVTKFNTKAEAQQTRDAMAKLLYSHLFDWIIFALNRYFRNELEYKPKSLMNQRKSYGKGLFSNEYPIQVETNNDLDKTKQDKNLCSISILDLFGFETFQYNSYEQLCINIANEQLQYFFRQHTFAWEMKEYENEGIEKTANFDVPNNRSILDMFLSKPIGLLALLDEESHFPQSTDFTLVNKWHENLRSPHFLSNSSTSKSIKHGKTFSSDRQTIFTIHHYAGHIQYTAKDFLEKNRDHVPIEVINLLSQSNDNLLNILFHNNLDKTSSSVYTSNKKSATINRTQRTVSTCFRWSLMELVSIMASTQPTFIRCLLPNRLPMTTIHRTYENTNDFPRDFSFDASLFDDNVILEQIKYNGLYETIEIRRRGYSHRILFQHFTSTYSCLIGVKVKLMKNMNDRKMCEYILNELNMKDYVFGKTKVFLKYCHFEHLNLLYNNLMTHIIRIQSKIRMFLIKKQHNISTKMSKNRNEFEQSVIRIQAVVRGFLVRSAKKKASIASTKIQSYWRMWYERTRFKRRLLQYHDQQRQISYFAKQIQWSGDRTYQHLKDLSQKNECLNQNLIEENTQSDQESENDSANSQTQNCINLYEYYNKIHREVSLKATQDIATNDQQGETSNKFKDSSNTIKSKLSIRTPKIVRQDESTKTLTYQRHQSAPAVIISPIEELKRVLNARKLKETNSTLPLTSCRSLSPSPLYSNTVNHSNSNEDSINNNQSDYSSIQLNLVPTRFTGLLTSTTSNLLGNMTLTSNDVVQLRGKLRKTGLADGNRTLRRKLPTEATQVDFRSVLRSSNDNLTSLMKKK